MKLLKNRFMSLVLTFAIVLSFLPIQANAESSEAFVMTNCDLIMPTDEEVASYPEAPLMNTTTVLPAVVDLSSNMPTPGNQGHQSSCVAWATVYAYKSYQGKMEHGWNLDNPAHIFSPAYVYNQLKCPGGGISLIDGFESVFDLLVNQGVCSMADMPYNDNDDATQPNAYQIKKAAENKAASWGKLPLGDVDEFKRHLAANDAIVIAVPVRDDLNNLSPSNPVYDEISGPGYGFHAICLVGYDDSLSAFKFINSGGPNWGLGGYGYISYNLIMQRRMLGYVMTDAVDPVKGEWNMEGSINNKVTDNYGIDGDIVGSGTFGNGVVGQAIKLTGSNYINIPNSSRYNNMTSFTLSAWVYPTSQSAEEYIISKVNPNRDFALDITNGTLDFHIAHGANYFHVYGGTVPLNTWTHVAAVYSNGTITLYQNGNPTATSSLGTFAPPDWTGTLMQIGAMNNVGGFHGKIDEVKVDSTALSSSEIYNLVQSPFPAGMWSFEGDTSSKGPYSSTGQFINGAVYYPYGITGQTAMFTGSNYIQIPSTAYNYMNSFTLSAWVYPASTSGEKYIISKTSPNRDFVLDIVNGALDFNIAHGTNYFHVYGSTVPLNTWTHVAAVYANGTVTLYQNGVQTATSSLGTFAPPDWSGTVMQIGAMNSVAGFTGKIDEVKVFKGELNPAQVKAEWVNGTTGHTP
jgi:C1A family cysteine protease